MNASLPPPPSPDAERSPAPVTSIQEGWTRRGVPGRAPWIIAASIVVAALIIAVSFTAFRDGNSSEVDQPGAIHAALQGAEQRAQDRAAQSTLRNALAAALTYFTDDNSFMGWNPDVAVQIEPYLTWAGANAAQVGIVTIDLVTDDQVVMSTLSESGQAFCIGKDEGFSAGPDAYMGRVDALGATSVNACSGGW